jgi:hypothetical protein
MAPAGISPADVTIRPLLEADVARRRQRRTCCGATTSGTRGATACVDFICAENGWAIDVGLKAGLSIGSCGPIFVRGRLGTLAPFPPNGAYL